MYYLKYRPQKIDELDLESVRERLANILAKKQVPHAFLFSGPRGAGKTSAARIVAKIVNCKARSEIEPCNKCSSCKSIMQGRHLDIIEIDAASNRGIDQIRDLRDKIGLSPSSSKYKVYIIDEVHMLTKEAFNALLKTLEEPPAHAIFILATTEPHRLPATVRSRCVEIPFPKATEKEVVRSLKRVVKGEDLEVGRDALSLIASVSDGSFRDATKLLEEAAARGKKIGMGEVEAVIGGGLAEVEDFLELLGNRNMQELLAFTNKQVADGMDVSWLTRTLLDKLHEEFLAAFGVSAKNSTEKTYKFSKGDLIRLMRLLEGAAREERNAVIVQMPLELAIIEWCQK